MLVAQAITFQPSCSVVNYAVQVPGNNTILNPLVKEFGESNVERCSFQLPVYGDTEGYQIRFATQTKMEEAYKKLKQIYRNVHVKTHVR